MKTRLPPPGRACDGKCCAGIFYYAITILVRSSMLKPQPRRPLIYITVLASLPALSQYPQKPWDPPLRHMLSRCRPELRGKGISSPTNTKGMTMLPSAKSPRRQTCTQCEFKPDKPPVERRDHGRPLQGRTVVVFSCPALYATCEHPPARYNELASVFRANGWTKSSACRQRRLCDERMEQDQEAGNHFDSRRKRRIHRRHGYAWSTNPASVFGKRSCAIRCWSKRRDQKMFIEPEKEGDPLEVSDATHAQVHQPESVAPRTGGDLRKPGCRTARAPRRCSTGVIATPKSASAAHHIEHAAGGIRSGHLAASLHRRQAHRQCRRSGSVFNARKAAEAVPDRPAWAASGRWKRG